MLFPKGIFQHDYGIYYAKRTNSQGKAIIELIPGLEEIHKAHIIDVNVGHVLEHIHYICNKMQQNQFKDKSFFLEIHSILKSINIHAPESDKIFESITMLEDLAYYYWIYKRNYIPWRDRDNFIKYMNIFDDIFNKTLRLPNGNNIQEMKVSLSIVYYFDTIIHN